ncbi:hypothetical protein [Rossellomorea marisflavi]|uniref:hypothetical protein n=1 Tax=Rossellomorea marisflavi TaxID=189381 RepID=UPI003562CDF7
MVTFDFSTFCTFQTASLASIAAALEKTPPLLLKKKRTIEAPNPMKKLHSLWANGMSLLAPYTINARAMAVAIAQITVFFIFHSPLLIQR